jgi:CRP-like cAMP-binding protein
MSPKLADLVSEAENLLGEKNYLQALADLGTVIQGAPADVRSRLLAGRALEGLKEKGRAFEVYSSLCLHCLRAGYPLVGLVALKRASAILANVDELIQTLMELYSLDSDLADPDLELAELPALPDQQAPPLLPRDGRLVSQVTQLAKNFGGYRYPQRLPHFPLISLLHAEAIVPVLDLMQTQHFRPGEFIVHEGDPCTTVYLLAAGEVEIIQGEKESRSLARLASGSIFGEMALLSDGPRMASARALRESDLLLLPVPEMQLVMEDLDDITLAVARFTRQRFLANLLASSPVFRHFDPERRRHIMERFTSVGIPTDEIIIREGQPGPGLYLILGGEVEVTKADAGSQVHLATLREGSVFGEISLVQDTPATATVRASRGGEFLFLSREDFHELVAEHPQIKEALKNLSRDRLAEQQSALDRAHTISESGSVII